jgi:hypothetical protein
MSKLIALLFELLGLNRPRPLTNLEALHEQSTDHLVLPDDAR